LADLLDSRKQQADQHGEDGDDYQQFDQSKRHVPRVAETRHGRLQEREGASSLRSDRPPFPCAPDRTQEGKVPQCVWPAAGRLATPRSEPGAAADSGGWVGEKTLPPLALSTRQLARRVIQPTSGTRGQLPRRIGGYPHTPLVHFLPEA